MATAKSPKDVFKRVHNRTVSDVYTDFIKPTLPVLAQDVGQKTIHRAKTRHGYTDRTGALTSSMRWKVRPKNGKRDYEVDIMAGGLGKVTRPLRVGIKKTASLGLTPTGKARLIRRRGRTATAFEKGAVSGRGDFQVRGVRQSQRQALKKGDIVVVNYARAVERKGYDVLFASVKWAERRLGKAMKDFLRGSTARI